jgi:hypothetical protein
MSNDQLSEPFTDDDARALSLLLARYAAQELDQFDHWVVETPAGEVFVQVYNERPASVAREVYRTIWPLPARLAQPMVDETP